jgi:hypothetical protein
VNLVIAFMALHTKFPGVLFDVGGGFWNYVAKVDSKIWRVIETYRSVKAGLE